MPYITPEAKARVLELGVPSTVGELNYLITHALVTYCATEGVSYQTINDCLGALEGAKLEFYRRTAAPYEEIKRMQNGDVY